MRCRTEPSCTKSVVCISSYCIHVSYPVLISQKAPRPRSSLPPLDDPSHPAAPRSLNVAQRKAQAEQIERENYVSGGWDGMGGDEMRWDVTGNVGDLVDDYIN